MIVQLPLAATVPPVNLALALPIASGTPALSVSVPPQELVDVAEASVIAPGVVGKVSVKLTMLSVPAMLLLSVRVSVETPLSAMVAGLNDLVMAGLVPTARVALALLPAPPLVELTGPVALV